MITREHFLARTGHEPVDDDLERSNCPDAGKQGHICCGWNHEQDMPCFLLGREHWTRPPRPPSTGE